MDVNKYRYEAIINHPHHVSAKHPQMSRHDRAAQFGSFKALTGYEDAIEESSRYVGSRTEPDDDAKAELDSCIRRLCDEGDGERISVIYFVHDSRKEGGEYRTAEGSFRRIDEVGQFLVMYEGDRIPLKDIYKINGGNYNGKL